MKKLVILIVVFLITSCSYIKDMKNYTQDNWYTGYELNKIYGKNRAELMREKCRIDYTNSHRTIRDNMRTGEIEYLIEN